MGAGGQVVPIDNRYREQHSAVGSLGEAIGHGVLTCCWLLRYQVAGDA